LPILFLTADNQRFLHSDWKKSLDKFSKTTLEDALKGYFALMINHGEACQYMGERARTVKLYLLGLLKHPLRGISCCEKLNTN
jgi:triosephosphate isomerase